jgi:plasmid stabilization system protein ParE
VSRVALSRTAIQDIERLVQFLRETNPEHAQATIGLILDAIAVLQDHPLIGRPTEGDLHELLISRGRSGYVALYEYRVATDQVVVHRIRHQREAGYDD